MADVVWPPASAGGTEGGIEEDVCGETRRKKSISRIQKWTTRGNRFEIHRAAPLWTIKTVGGTKSRSLKRRNSPRGEIAKKSCEIPGWRRKKRTSEGRTGTPFVFTEARNGRFSFRRTRRVRASASRELRRAERKRDRGRESSLYL